MPYPKTNPVSERELFTGEHPGHHTICQNNRDTYRIIQGLDIPEDVKSDLLERIRLNFAFGKRMHKKLREYRWRYDDEEKNRTYEQEI
jgi:isopropylmalate/homocitrate/citramalate synthase